MKSHIMAKALWAGNETAHALRSCSKVTPFSQNDTINYKRKGGTIKDARITSFALGEVWRGDFDANPDTGW